MSGSDLRSKPQRKRRFRTEPANRVTSGKPIVYAVALPLTAAVLAMSLAACHESDKAEQLRQPTGVMRETAVSTGSTGGRETKYIDDSLVTMKIKTALFRDPKASGFQINVNTYRGIVQLSGFVDTLDQKQRAGELAGRVVGVQAVHNDLIVTSGTDFTSAVGESSEPPSNFNVRQSSQGDEP